PVCLAFFASVIACIGEYPDFEQGNWLEFLVGRRKAVLLEKEVACLLDDILQGHKARLIFFQALLQSSNGFLDGRSIFAHGSLFRSGANEAIRENGGDQFKRFSASGLLAQEPPNDCTLA